jgi:hypothetical protein
VAEPKDEGFEGVVGPGEDDGYDDQISQPLPPFWQPEEEGEIRVGVVMSIRQTRFSPSVHLMTVEYGLISVPVGGALKDIAWDKYIGREVKFTFKGWTVTKGIDAEGKPRRLRVIDVRGKKIPDNVPF